MPHTTEPRHSPLGCRRRAAANASWDHGANPLHLVGFRYYGLDDVIYERRTLLVGGPLVMSITGIASALANRRRRQEAERAAAPQWRSLGRVVVEVRTDRLLVHRNGEQGTVWLASVVDVRPDLVRQTVDIFFERDAPFRFQGEGAAELVSATWVGRFVGD